jgi:hypothetical protein
VPEKNRSAGITVIAILAFIGSALFLLLAVFMAIAMIAAPPSAPNDARLPAMFFNVLRVALPLFYALPAVWGIVTAIGLLQVKNWARISTIIFSVLLIVFGVFGTMSSTIFFLKPPPGTGVDPKMFFIIGAIAALFALAQIGIGIWWIIFFNRATVKVQFLSRPLPYSHLGQGMAPYPTNMPSSATPPPPSLATPADLASTADLASPPTPPIAAPNRPARPLSISIIAWFLLVTCLFVPFNIILHPPAILFATILTGRPAVILFLVIAALNLYIGVALLKMRPAGRLAGIGYSIFGLLNTAVFFFVPGRSARIAKLLELQYSMFPWMRSTQTDSPFFSDPTPFLMIGAVAGVLFSLVLLYFLAAAKPAFDRAARERLG